MDNTSAHCDSAADLSHLRSFRARACQRGDSRQKLSIYQDLDTVYVYVLYRTRSKALHNAVAASFFPALVSSIQFARDVEFSIFSEAERLV